MIKIKSTLIILIGLISFSTLAQPKKTVGAKPAQSYNGESLVIPISKADLGTFPYFKTLPNFYANDSVTQAQNATYFFDGKKFFTVEGKISTQSLNVSDKDKKFASEFQCIQEFDKLIATLGGVKIYTGKLPEDKLKAYAGSDIVEAAGKRHLAPSAHYGVVEYVIKTPEKEVWVQLQPYSLESKFYTLLVVEKQTPLIALNTNKQNQILEDLEKNKKSVIHLSFEPDNANLLSDSKDEILSIAGIFQAHPDWSLKMDFYNAPVGTPEYVLALTEKRAKAVKDELVKLGVNSASLNVKGFGDQKPIVPNDTEQGRLANTRVEITPQ